MDEDYIRYALCFNLSGIPITLVSGYDHNIRKFYEEQADGLVRKYFTEKNMEEFRGL